jgi:hypothetical protein
MRYNYYVHNIFWKSRKSGACVKIAFVFVYSDVVVESC